MSRVAQCTIIAAAVRAPASRCAGAADRWLAIVQHPLAWGMVLAALPCG